MEDLGRILHLLHTVRSASYLSSVDSTIHKISLALKNHHAYSAGAKFINAGKVAIAMEVICISESESSKLCADLNSRGDPPPLGAAQGIYMSSTAQTSFSGTWMPTGTQLVSQEQSEEEKEADFGQGAWA